MSSSAGPKLDKAARLAAKKARKLARRAQRKALNLANPASVPGAVLENAVSCAYRPLPLIPKGLAPGATTICLMYQYKEPAWTAKQHKAALNNINKIARNHRITGRGRCAPEGVNCTLTGTAQNMRAFCYALRAYDSLFDATDFKLTDGEPASAMFRTFTLRKVEELVSYGLGGECAPSLDRHAGKHLEAVEYHETMKRKDAVIIDVRNAYESAIGHFAPPKDGATLLDPKMRVSTDFPKWLNAPETKAKLHGKTVMMYCTGGIRCERATALLNQMTEAEADGSFKPKEVVMARGGIERYLKTFPTGGFWKGKNYLFDKRMEQVPSKKSEETLAAEVESFCCVCHTPYASYRGQYKCARCAVPVIVCPVCIRRIEEEGLLIHANTQRGILGTNGIGIELVCPLCVEGYSTPSTAPDLVGQKRKLGLIKGGRDIVSGKVLDTVLSTTYSKAGNRMSPKPCTRLYIGKMPLTMTASSLRASLRKALGQKIHGGADSNFVKSIHWIIDCKSGFFYGAAFVLMAQLDDAKKIVSGVQSSRGLEILQLRPPESKTNTQARRKSEPKIKYAVRRRKGKAQFAPLKEGEEWPVEGHKESEYPPILM